MRVRRGAHGAGVYEAVLTELAERRAGLTPYRGRPNQTVDSVPPSSSSTSPPPAKATVTSSFTSLEDSRVPRPA